MAAAAFAGGAYAANQDSTANSRQAFLNDVAKRLNVTPAQLSSALQGAVFDQLDAAVAAGKLTQAQASAIKQSVQLNGGAPLGFGGLGLLKGPRFFGGPPPFAPDAGGRLRLFGAGRLSAAAKYLGISEVQLSDQLASGKSLAQIVASRGKSVAGLKSAMIAAAKAKLDQAVTGKLITSAQEQQILSRLSSRLDTEINDTGQGDRFGMRRFGYNGRIPYKSWMESGGSLPAPPAGPAAPPPPGAGLPY